MDQATVNATTDFLKETINKYETHVKQLEEHIQKVTQRSLTESAERNRMRDEMKDWTLNAIQERLVSESDAEEIANICGFELTQEFELEVTVNYSIIVNATNEEEAQSLIHDIDFDSVSTPVGVEYLSSTVDRVDI